MAEELPDADGGVRNAGIGRQPGRPLRGAGADQEALADAVGLEVALSLPARAREQRAHRLARPLEERELTDRALAAEDPQVVLVDGERRRPGAHELRPAEQGPWPAGDQRVASNRHVAPRQLA